MANVGSTRTKAEVVQVGLQNGLMDHYKYVGELTFDASPAAQEVFLGGVKDCRLNIPTDCVVMGQVVCSAWNITDGDTPAGAIIYFGIENDGGTVAITPTNIRATDGNPINEFDMGVGTWAVAADDTNKALTLSFTGTASKVYHVQATAMFAAAGANFNQPNKYGTTT